MLARHVSLPSTMSAADAAAAVLRRHDPYSASSSQQGSPLLTSPDSQASTSVSFVTARPLTAAPPAAPRQTPSSPSASSATHHKNSNKNTERLQQYAAARSDGVPKNKNTTTQSAVDPSNPLGADVPSVMLKHADNHHVDSLPSYAPPPTPTLHDHHDHYLTMDNHHDVVPDAHVALDEYEWYHQPAAYAPYSSYAAAYYAMSLAADPDDFGRLYYGAPESVVPGALDHAPTPTAAPPVYRAAVEALAAAGEELPDEAARLLAKMEKKRKNRRLRVIKKRELFREAMAAKQQAAARLITTVSADPSSGDRSAAECSADSADERASHDANDDAAAHHQHLHDQQSSSTDAHHATLSDIDPDERTVPVVPVKSPSIPLPRSKTTQSPVNAATSLAFPSAAKSRSATPSLQAPTVAEPKKSDRRDEWPLSTKRQASSEIEAPSTAKAAAKPAKPNAQQQWRTVPTTTNATTSSAATKAPTATAASTAVMVLSTTSNPFAALTKGSAATTAAATKTKDKAAVTPSVATTKTNKATTVAKASTSANTDATALLAKTLKEDATAPPKMKKPPAAAKTTAKGVDEFELILAQLTAATAARPAAKKQAPPKGPTPVSVSGSADELSVLATSGPDRVPTHARIEQAVTHVSGVVEDVVRVLRRAESSRRNPMQRYNLMRPLEKTLDFPKNVPRAVHALLLLEFSDLWYDFQEFDRALELAELSFSLLPDDCENAMRAKYRVAKALEQLGEVDDAMAAVDVCMTHAHKLGDAAYLGYAAVLNSVCAEYMGNAHVAKHCLEAAEHIGRSIGDRALLTDTLVNRAAAMIARGEYRGARECLALAEPMVEAAADSAMTVKFLSHRSQFDFAVGRATDAVDRIIAAHARFQESKEHFPMASCCTLLGMFYRCLGLTKQAREWYLKELQLASAHLPQRLCESNGNLGCVTLEMDEPTAAKQYHLKELDIAKKAHDMIAECKAQLGLAAIDLRTGDAETSRKRSMTVLHLVRAYLQSPDAERYLTRVGAYEVEWRALDVVEASHLARGHTTDALLVADEKRSAAVSRRLTLPTAFADPKTWISAARSHGFTHLVSYSFLWDDVCDSIGMYTCDCETQAVTFRKLLYPAHALALLVAEGSAYRQRVYSGDNDVVMLPFQVTRLAEAFAESHPELMAASGPDGLPLEWAQVFYAAFVAPAELPLPAADADVGDAALFKVAFVVDGLLSNIPFHELRPKNHRHPLVHYAEVAQMPSLRALVSLMGEMKPRPSGAAVVVTEVPLATSAESIQASVAAVALDAEDPEQQRHSSIFDWRIVDDARDRVAGAVMLDVPCDDAVTPPTHAVQPSHWRGPPSVKLESICPTAATGSQQHLRTAIVTHAPLAAPRAGHELGVSPRTFFFCCGFTAVITPLHGLMDRRVADELAKSVHTAADFRNVYRRRASAASTAADALWSVIFTGC